MLLLFPFQKPREVREKERGSNNLKSCISLALQHYCHFPSKHSLHLSVYSYAGIFRLSPFPPGLFFTLQGIHHDTIHKLPHCIWDPFINLDRSVSTGCPKWGTLSWIQPFLHRKELYCETGLVCWGGKVNHRAFDIYIPSSGSLQCTCPN